MTAKPTLYLTTLLTAIGFMLIGYDNVSVDHLLGLTVIGRHGWYHQQPAIQRDVQQPLGRIARNHSSHLRDRMFCRCTDYCGGWRTARTSQVDLHRCSAYVGRRWIPSWSQLFRGHDWGQNRVGAWHGEYLGLCRSVHLSVQGFINSTVPVLQSEVSPAHARGRFVCFQLSLLNLGIFLAYWVGYGFTPMTGSKAWRIPVALQAVFIVPIMILVFIVPESPRWLAAHGRPEDSLAVIARLQNKPSTHHDVLLQHKEIQDAVQLEQSIGSGSWADLLKEDKLCSRRRLLIACAIQFFQQVGGINAIIFYAGNFFSLVSDKASLLAGGLFTWFFIASFIPWLLIDTAGRRKLLLICISGMALAFALESALVWKVQTTSSKAAAGAAIAVLFVYMGLFTVSAIGGKFNADFA